MTKREFREIFEYNNRQKPRLMIRSHFDSLATEQQIELAESKLGCKIPLSYRELLQDYGGGEIGFVTIFSMDPKSDWELLKQVNNIDFPAEYLPISEDGTGGFYLLNLNDENDFVWFWDCNERQSPQQTRYRTIYDYVARYAFEPA